MIKIGITGGIGSGKTTICRIFETLGVPVFYADQVAKEVMVDDVALMNGLKQEFGEESYINGNILNRSYIANVVFQDEHALAKLNALVHPAVFRAFDSWVSTINSNSPYVLKEAALLFESGSYKMCDQNVLVTAPFDLKMKRVMARDGFTFENVKARMDKQLSDEEKADKADYIVTNDEISSLILQVLDLHYRFLTILPK